MNERIRLPSPLGLIQIRHILYTVSRDGAILNTTHVLSIGESWAHSSTQWETVSVQA